jgi:hypothetical protein
MRILNIVYNTNKISATYKTQKIIDTGIFGLTSTLEKPTRGKPVRKGDFIISEV